MRKSVVIILSLVFCFSFVSSSGMWHSADEFNINIDGTNISLQDAFDDGLLTGSYAYAAPDFNLSLGHSVADVWISTESGEMTLLNALTSGIRLHGDSLTYSGIIPPTSHLATNVIFDSGGSLQEIINLGSVCSSDMGNPCGGSICVYEGTINCDGICVGTVNKETTISCGATVCGSYGGWYCSGKYLTRAATCTKYYCNGAGTCSSSNYVISQSSFCRYGCSCATSRTIVGGGTICACSSAPDDDCLRNGKLCVFDSQCCSDDCSWFKC